MLGLKPSSAALLCMKFAMATLALACWASPALAQEGGDEADEKPGHAIEDVDQAEEARQLANQSANQPAQTVKLSTLPLLFADDTAVTSQANLSRTFHTAKTRAEPVIKAEKPNDRVYIYGTAASDPDNGPNAARMWFMHVGRPGTGVGTRVLYATSPDGVTWPKISECKEVFKVSSPSVLIDPFEKDPAKRFKIMGGKKAYKIAYSPDGVTWTETPKTGLSGGDTLTLTQNPYTGEYLCFRKSERSIRGKYRRVVSLMRSSDFVTWTPARLVFAPDEIDDAYSTDPEHKMQIYGMSVYPHAAGFIGLAMMFQITQINENTGPATSGQDGPIDVQIVTSKDANKWERSTPRLAMIPRGKHGGFDKGAILGVSNNPVHTADHTNVYYTALTTGHGGAMPEKQVSIGLAQWRLHGFASLDAKAAVGKLETVPLVLTGGKLVVNADASRGEIKVGLLEADGKPIPGFAVEDCDPLKTDNKAWTATWKGKSAAPGDRQVKVVVQMKDASLYSLSSPGKAQ